MIGAIIALAIQTAQQIQSTRTGLGNFKALLTNPTDGLQTQAGKALAEIIRQYEEIKKAGINSPDTINTVINEIERVRAAFETKVKETLGGMLYYNGGAAGIQTINSVAERLTSDRRAELTQLVATPSAGAGSISETLANLAPGGNLMWVVVVVVILILLKHR